MVRGGRWDMRGMDEERAEWREMLCTRKHDIHAHEYQLGGPATQKHDTSCGFTNTYRAEACLIYSNLSADLHRTRRLRSGYTLAVHKEYRTSGISKQMCGWCSRDRLRVLPTKRFAHTDRTRTDKALASPCTRWCLHQLRLHLPVGC